MTLQKTGNTFLAEVKDNIIVADDGFLDYAGPIDDAFVLDTRYDGPTWVPHLNTAFSQYSAKIITEKLKEISQPYTRESITGRLIVINAFGGERYALRATKGKESLDLLLPEHAALYARLDKASDNALLKITCEGFYDEPNEHGTKTTKYHVAQLEEISTPKRKPLYPALAERVKQKREKEKQGA